MSRKMKKGTMNGSVRASRSTSTKTVFAEDIHSTVHRVNLLSKFDNRNLKPSEDLTEEGHHHGR